MTRCAMFAAALIDETLERPQGLEEHLVGCAGCRDLRAAHEAALGLEHIEVPVAASRPAAAGVRWWAGSGPSAPRRVFRPLVLGLTGVAAGLALWSSGVLHRTDPGDMPQPSAARRAEVAGVQGPLHEQPITVLVSELNTDLQRKVTVHDRSYAVFGGLSQWLAPPSGRVAADLMDNTQIRQISWK